jgi:hypothetical protein
LKDYQGFGFEDLDWEGWRSEFVYVSALLGSLYVVWKMGLGLLNQ